MNEMDYIYLGDRLTRPELRRMPCRAVRRSNGKCIRGRNGNMLVEFPGVGKVVVLGRLLRKLKNKKKFFWRLKEYTYICGMKQQRPGVFPAI